MKNRPMAVTVLGIVALVAGVIVLLEALLFFGVALFGILRRTSSAWPGWAASCR